MYLRVYKIDLNLLYSTNHNKHVNYHTHGKTALKNG